MTYYRVDYNSTRSALRLSREEGRRPLSRSLDTALKPITSSSACVSSKLTQGASEATITLVFYT